MSLKLAIPEGHVNGHCLTCKRDVFVREGTLACPNGPHEIEPTSLARLPDDHRGEAVFARMAAEPTPPIVSVVERPSLRSAQIAKAEPQPVERIELPAALLDWYRITCDERDSLTADETYLAEQLRRVRQARKLLDGLLARIVEPEGGTDAAPDTLPEPVPEPTVEVTPVLVVPEPEPIAVSAPMMNGHVEMTPEPAAPSAKRWALEHDRCINPACGTTERKHAANGRCSRCHAYWFNHDTERPADLPDRTSGGNPS